VAGLRRSLTEAGHLLHDARRAVEELRATGLRVNCIACDANGLAELRPVFGPTGLHFLDAAATAKSDWLDAGRSILGR
jgi:nitric oxide reductase NorD protein